MNSMKNGALTTPPSLSPGLDQHQQEMDDAPQRLQGRTDPVYYRVRGENAQELTLAPFTQNLG
jgi:hypothetical protein